ncbi:N-acetylmuramoyl-L-alanine amidase CwlD [Herbivorax sp. ANBcel31]|uniref:N-acetylmuramoyl-L-alanine amidase CwlD n=1 Tax=Herbivorax sp. ANBcel31 TaxID=3069754 RepID=UPI0027AE0AE3|nr:N-acetylmuramoyl-L-alanine amidase CwlD [Herbivorax sp. ANBcel31]MDQ2084901.1 N-acetylmuramoyl-L-alanine amidase CwlD [Herbivorax sp. ANBcel31]
MIFVFRKDKILLIALIFLLSIIVYSLKFNFNAESIETTNADMMKKNVIIDSGHGGEDPGAVSDYSGIKEKDVNLAIGKRVKELLEEEDFKVIMTREEDGLQYEEGTKGYTNKRRQDLQMRKKVMDKEEADIVVSIHLNKFPQTQYHGAQAFFPKNSAESKKLAECIQKSLKEFVDPENKREALVKDTQILILRDIKKPTVIVECGFLSNPEEEQKLSTQEYQEKLAFAIKEGIKKYYGL